ncbi:hypothetical protein BU16DRAFT_532458 [Lophium mytilinum]|uniref:Uncharacterized protein n=1 Tax=Lophium mytilinum TaxID=390894 RepID=A0A6A6RCE8_9PEZI|nr:hypothetical protein BU16DRAFT_532458 [Lophium mytilinum]
MPTKRLYTMDQWILILIRGAIEGFAAAQRNPHLPSAPSAIPPAHRGGSPQPRDPPQNPDDVPNSPKPHTASTTPAPRLGWGLPSSPVANLYQASGLLPYIQQHSTNLQING